MLRGTRIGAAYIAATVDGKGINEGIVDAVDDAGDDIKGKGTEQGENHGDEFSEGFVSRIRGKIGSRLSSVIGAERVGAQAGDEAGDSFVDRMSDKVRDMGDRIGAELSDRLASNPEQVRRGIDRAFDDDMLDRVSDRIGARMAAGIAESLDRNASTIADALDRALEGAVSGNKGSRSAGREGVAGLIGRLLGEGSRNNFLNFFGKTMGNVASLTEKAATFAGTFASNMGKAGEGASLITRIMAGFGGGGGGIARLAASAPAAVLGIGAVTLAMTVLVSVASALLGVVVALASTIASALVAALAVGAGALGALSVAAGLVTIAFTSMTNAQSKALSSAFQPLKAAATGLGQIMIQQMVPAFDSWSKSLQVALALAVPLAEVMGGAFARAGNIVTEAFSGPGVQMLITMLAVTLPAIIVNLSKAFAGFLNGVSGVFTALLPFVLKFSAYLSGVASDFARWATSARGQNSISDFVDRAVRSLKSLWNFVKAVGGLIADLLFNPKGQQVGNSIFDDMARAVRKFSAYITKEGRLEDWFKRARKFATLLGDAISGIGKIIRKLDSSATIDVLVSMASALETSFKWAKKVYGALEDFGDMVRDFLPPIVTLEDLLGDTANEAERTRDAIAAWRVPEGMLNGAAALNQLLLGPINGGNPIMGPFIDPSLAGLAAQGSPGTGASNLADLINSGNTALNNTFESNGGYMPDPTDPSKGSKGGGRPTKTPEFEGGPVVAEWQNTYAAFVASIMSQLPSLRDEIQAAFLEARDAIYVTVAESAKILRDLVPDLNALFVGGINDALATTDVSAVMDGISSVLQQTATNFNAVFEQTYANANAGIGAAIAARDQMIATAQNAVDAAAQRLAGAGSPKEAKAAQKQLDAAFNALNLAQRRGDQLVAEADAEADRMIAAAEATGAGIARANAILAGQGVYTFDNALNLARGMKVENATLADFAEARRWASERLGEANQKLAAAIDLRDSYSNQIADSIRTFGTLLSAQAKTINGVQQALTANDIVESMQERLDKVKKFQENLRLLLASGLSNEAYKQIVDAGVEQGGAYAEAILGGGQGAVSQVNSLTEQFSQIADELGVAAGSQMYQAGVDAAQGLVDGLTSLSSELESAATALGAAIAASIRRELGIASPSKVLRDMMNDVGDGAVLGLDDQAAKIQAASQRFSDQIAVSPEVAAHAATLGTSPTTQEGGEVSGNNSDPRFRDLIVHTPTEDPHGVAQEVLNEVVGRLP